MSKIAIVGGTGELGRGLGARLAAAGHEVILGSRNPEAAEALANQFGGRVSTAENGEAAGAAEIIFVAVPFSHQEEALRQILPFAEGKIIVDTTVCLKPPKVGTVQLPAAGSAGLAAGMVVGKRAALVSGFHNISAAELQSGQPVRCHVLLTSNDRPACDTIIALCRDIGVRGLYAGPLANSVATEGLTSVLITLNRQFKVHAGIMITELPE